MDAPLLYFAYGSNLRSAQMRRLCPGHIFVAPARLDGHRLAFTLPDEEWAGGVADLVPATGREVWGALYRITMEDLAALDAYEGFDPEGTPEQNAYDRRCIDVTTVDGILHRDVWCYFAHNPRGHVTPSEAYRAALLEGATERGLPISHVDAMRAAFEESE
ncbi:MAG: gamma-glutamylcyclotransferase [Chthoniobacterales bacterium]|nr:gamma-glutamylcyclotransferase [Chthoniobacterales bacterium]